MALRRKVGFVGAVVVRWRERARVVARGSVWTLVVLVAEPCSTLAGVFRDE